MTDLATQIEALSAAATRVAELEGVLVQARGAIASLPEFALGGVALAGVHTGEPTGQYGVRDELLSKIDQALKGRLAKMGEW